MTTAVSAAPHDRSSRGLYVLTLEEAIRQLDRLLISEGITIDCRHPQDTGVDEDTASLVEDLRA